jgi:hypothetical protein
MTTPRATGARRTVWAREHRRKRDKANVVLTQEALVRVFAHADEKCENMTTLHIILPSQKNGSTRDANGICETYRVADNCDNATRRLPCCRK